MQEEAERADLPDAFIGFDRLGDAQVLNRHTRRRQFLAMVQFASLRLWLRAYESTA